MRMKFMPAALAGVGALLLASTACIKKSVGSTDASIASVASATSAAFSCTQSLDGGDYCWQPVDATEAALSELTAQCVKASGEAHPGAYCESSPGSAQCTLLVANAHYSIVGYFIGSKWSNDRARTTCQGAFSAGVYESLFSANCQTPGDNSAVCIEYQDVLQCMAEVLKQDCPGVFTPGTPCNVVAGTLGCRTAHEEIKGTQTFWYPGQRDIAALCSGGEVVVK